MPRKTDKKSGAGDNTIFLHLPEQTTMREEIKKLRKDLERARSQFYIFYELTKVMRTTLRLEEIVYIILTGLTSHQGLAFNRAVLFLTDEENKKINGFMGIGPMDTEEADAIWKSIEEHKMSLYDLTRAYHRLKEEKKPRLWEFVQCLSFPFSKKAGLIYEVLFERDVLHIAEEDTTHELEDDPLIYHLKLKDFLISPLWIKGAAKGVIAVDNYITKKPITNEDVVIFNMFVEQAQGAIENSQVFEDTLTKAHTDSLTSLWNHGYFQYRLDEELAKARLENSSLTIMMIDLDDFKKFNDHSGHIEGDKALKSMGEIIKESCRKIDILCRYGGEEFSLILPSTTKKEAYYLAERIRRQVEKKEIANNKFTISIGIASYPQNAEDKKKLIKKADDALYAAKRNGKNQVTAA